MWGSDLLVTACAGRSVVFSQAFRAVQARRPSADAMIVFVQENTRCEYSRRRKVTVLSAPIHGMYFTSQCTTSRSRTVIPSTTPRRRNPRKAPNRVLPSLSFPRARTHAARARMPIGSRRPTRRRGGVGPDARDANICGRFHARIWTTPPLQDVRSALGGFRREGWRSYRPRGLKKISGRCDNEEIQEREDRVVVACDKCSSSGRISLSSLACARGPFTRRLDSGGDTYVRSSGGR